MIVWLDGPINAGKTTVAKRLATLRPHTVHIEVDDLRHFADCLSLEECIPFCVDDAAALTRNWVKRGFDVVVSWPVSAANVRHFAAQVSEQVHVFTLLPRREVALAQRGERVLSDRERRRVELMYDSEFSEPAGLLIDNSDESAERTTERISAILAAEL